MKRLYAIIGMAGALMVPSLYANIIVDGNSYDGTLELGYGTPQYGEGGAFLVSGISGGPLAHLGSFDTFCVQTTVYFEPGGTVLYYNLTTAGVNLGTAYLFSRFWNGDYSANYLNSTLTGQTLPNVGLLQQAIWYFQHQITAPGDSPPTYNPPPVNPFVTAAEGAVGAAAAFNPANGKWGVNLLELYNPGNTDGLQPYWDNSSDRQFQLTVVPEPTTLIAGALLLLPFGASTLRILRKQNRAA
jgi:hypothetical protein